MSSKSLKKLINRVFLITLTTSMLVGVTAINRSSQAESLTSVSVTLSNARPSFRGALAAGNAVASSVVTINTTANAYPSTSSAQLVEGDIVSIGEAGSLGSYTVASTSSLSTFTITSGLASGDADTGDDVIATTSASQTVRFTTANAIANGRFRVLVPSLASDTASADGIPDGGKFDFGASAPTVTCPADVGSTYDFVAGAATASAITIDGNDYHVFECAYSGTGASGTAFNNINIASLINPAPVTNHTTGYADAYNIIVQHLDSSLGLQDSTTVQVGVVEAVKVTATVPAQITFRIIGIDSGTTVCGAVTTDVTTTAASVPFGSIPIDSFTDAAQTLTVSTNAENGFVVTGIENDQLGKDGGACAGEGSGINDCIPDSEASGMDEDTSANWTSVADKGFAYSLDDNNSTTTETFQYNDGGNTFAARHFAATADSETAQTLFSSTTVADNQNLRVCYRIIPEVTTEAGNYENHLNYTATATF